MKVYTKNYIGKGQQVVTNAGAELDIVKVCLSVEKMMEFVHEHEGKEYVSFEVAKMRKTDDYKNTHTVYHTTIGESVEQTTKAEPTAETPKKKRGRPSKAEIAKRAESVENRQNLVDVPTNKEKEALKVELQNAEIDRN
jgi:hypothetical protein